MLTIESGPKGTFLPGAVRVVSDALGKILVEGRFAVEVVAEVENAGAPGAPESAVVRPKTPPRARK